MKNVFLITFVALISALCSAQSFQETMQLTTPNPAELDQFGSSVSISNNYAIVGAHFKTGGATDSSQAVTHDGMAYIYEKSTNSTWDLIQELTASDRSSYDGFGGAVAISGNYAIVGAVAETTDAFGNDSLNRAGAAYVFERNATGGWIQTAKLVASDREAFNHFGWSVSLDDNYVFIGALYENEDSSGNNTMSSAGAVYIFKRQSNGNWVEIQKIVASDRGIGDNFGLSISVNNNIAVVGVENESEDPLGGNTLNSSGSAYVFELQNNGLWVETQKIVASDRSSYDRFGFSVSVNNNIILIGAFYEKEDPNGNNTVNGGGSVYIFEKNTLGDWEETQKIVASDRENEYAFGHSVSHSGDYALIGAITNIVNIPSGQTIEKVGSIYVFSKDSIGVWSETQKLMASDADSNDFFGYSVCINGNNSIIGALQKNIISTSGTSIADAGSAYIFEGSPSVGITEINLATISLYPNPNSGLFYISVRERNTTINIFSVEGKLILSNLKITKKNQRIHLDNPAKGVYLVQVIGGTSTQTIRLIIR